MSGLARNAGGLLAVLLLASGCATAPQQAAEIRACSTAECGPGARYSAAQLAAGLRRLLKANAGAQAALCDSNPKTRACESIGVCHFVQGGMLPGNGCSKGIAFTEAASDQAGALSLKAEMPLTFLWTPVLCPELTGTLSVRSADDIAFEFQTRTCAWMVVGVFRDTFKFSVESVDLARGEIGGYYSETEAGTAWGKGAGYVVLKFPHAMPEGENWLAEQPAPQPPALPGPPAQLSGAQP